MERYVLSCSFGKDSLASAILALEHGEPLTEALYCETMFDKEISAEVPEHRAFIYDTAIPWLENHGIKAHVVRGEKTFVDLFQKQIGGDGRHAGKIWAWPLCGRCYINRDCKVRPMERYKAREWKNDTVIQYIGIADDEADRLARLDGTTKVSLLAKYGKTEADAVAICRKAGLYSPSYEFTSRNGCFFCPNAKWRELRHLYDHHPELWKRLLELQALPNKATDRFTRTERFCDIDEQFRLDDAQLSLFGVAEPVPFDQTEIQKYAIK